MKITDVVYSSEPSLHGLFKSNRTDEVKVMLTYLISDIVLSFNVGKSMNAMQIGDTVRLIISTEEFHHFKPMDFRLCFDRVKTGRYGKVYDRIDTMIIFEWLRFYDSEREEEIITTNRTKALMPPAASNPVVSYQPILDDLEKIMTEKKERAKKQVAYADQLNDRLQKSWIKAFDRRYEKNGFSQGVKFIQFKEPNKKPLSMVEFLEMRHERYLKMIHVPELILEGRIVATDTGYMPIVKHWFKSWHLVPGAFISGYIGMRDAQVVLNKYVRDCQPTAFKLNDSDKIPASIK